MALLPIAGIDGSLTNFGIARMLIDTETLELTVEDLALIKTEPNKAKQVRVSSDNLARSQQLHTGAVAALKGCSIGFAEVPSGGQSAKACMAFGITIGIYAGLPLTLLEVSPSETKLATVGTRTASKQEMIEWAVGKYPNAAWRRARGKADGAPTLDNEHLADAIAIVHAGIKLPAFKQVIAMLNARAA